MIGVNILNYSKGLPKPNISSIVYKRRISWLKWTRPSIRAQGGRIDVALNTNLQSLPKRGLLRGTRLNSTASGNGGKSTTQSKNFRGDILKILRLAGPEYKTLLLALLCLFATSTVSMSLPYVMGKILDSIASSDKNKESDDSGKQSDEMAKKDNEVANEMTKKDDGVVREDDEVAKDDEAGTIMGLPPTQFYFSLGVFFVVGSVANFGRTYLLRLVGEKLVSRLRSRVFSKMLTQDAYFFDVGPSKQGMKTGELISRITSDTQVISKTMSGNISDGARSLINGFVGLSMMCLVSLKLTICMSMIFPPLILMSLFYGRRIKNLSRQIQETLAGMTKVTEEKLNGLKTIQSFSQQQFVVHQFNKEIKNIFSTSMREGKLSGIYFGVNGLLGNATMVGLLAVGTQLIQSGELTTGDLTSFMMYAVYTGSSVFGLGNFYSELMKGVGAAERIFEILESKPKISATLGKKVDDLHGDIVFENVEFSYPSRPDTKVFQDINLTIKKGENVCFVGPSGCGKSTISQLLLRFYDPNSGSVAFNGHDITDLNLNHFRSHIGYVSQDSLLFSGSIKENILFGKPKATPQELDRALLMSNSSSFIDQLPLGLDTVIGSSNSNQLSGGQRQRLSLSRALIRNPSVLILDEATSALDSISEEIVMRSLANLNRSQGLTLICIAHRLSTIKCSDRIIVLNAHGQIVEDGPFAALYSDNSSELNKLLKSSNMQ